MLFKKLTLIPYGQYDGIHRVYKVYLVNYETNLLLQGYLIKSKEKSLFVVCKQLNELYDDSVINTNDIHKYIPFTKNGTYSIEIFNNKIAGLNRTLIATLEIDFMNTLIKEDDKLFSDDLIKKALLPLYEVNMPLANYLFLSILIEYKKAKAVKFSYSSLEELIQETLLMIYKSKQFQSLLSTDDDVLLKYNLIFPMIMPLNIQNIANFCSLIKVLEDSDVSIYRLKVEDILYAIELSKEIPFSNVPYFLEMIQKYLFDTITLDMTESKEKLLNDFKDVILKFYKINKICLKRNSTVIFDDFIPPVYSTEFFNNLNNNNTFAILNDKLDLIIDFNKPLLTYKTKDKTYITKGYVNDNFEYENTDTNIFTLTLENRGE